jgi:hypothetical protein
MTAKQYLSRVRILDIKINNKISELSMLKSKSTSLQAVVINDDKVQTSPALDRLGNDVSDILELEEEIHKEIKRYNDLKHKIINEIHSLNNRLYIEILYKRYVEFKSLEEIAVDMNYSYEWIKHNHGYALLNFNKKMGFK